MKKIIALSTTLIALSFISGCATNDSQFSQIERNNFPSLFSYEASNSVADIEAKIQSDEKVKSVFESTVVSSKTQKEKNTVMELTNAILNADRDELAFRKNKDYTELDDEYKLLVKANEYITNTAFYKASQEPTVR